MVCNNNSLGKQISNNAGKLQNELSDNFREWSVSLTAVLLLCACVRACVLAFLCAFVCAGISTMCVHSFLQSFGSKNKKMVGIYVQKGGYHIKKTYVVERYRCMKPTH